MGFLSLRDFRNEGTEKRREYKKREEKVGEELIKSIIMHKDSFRLFIKIMHNVTYIYIVLNTYMQKAHNMT